MSVYAFFFLDARRRNLYETLRKALFRHEQAIPVRELPADEISLILKAVLTDTPELFWFEGKWEYGRAGDRRYIRPVYTFDAAASREIQGRLDGIGRKIVTAASAFTQDLDRARYVYDWLISHVRYGFLSGRGQTVYDALVNRSAVCKGLSKSFQYLLKQLNCFSTLREGTLDGVGTHMWNVAGLSGNYFNVDVSMGYDSFSCLFDEGRRNNQYRCFAVPDAGLSKFHTEHRLPWPSLICDQDHPGGN